MNHTHLLHRAGSAALLLSLGACQTPGASSGMTPGAGLPTTSQQVMVGAGDIASCESDRDEATAAMLDGIDGTVFTLGDNAYPDGSAEDFERCYAPSWGRHKQRTHPTPGNHEYHSARARPYFEYFGAAAGEPGKGYYSYDLGGWHVVALNSELSKRGLAEQERWLREDLKAHPARCTLAYMHRPLFSSGLGRDNAVVKGIWEALYEAGADVVLAGHDHFYERFAPQTPEGVADAERGLREFVVGTGGKELYVFGPTLANSEVRLAGTFGLMKLTLEDGAYSWEFIQVGGDVRDQGRGACH
ncbi:metallophosphoesterase [Vitiosangium sp. GDMCC 1.1324]|uniref:metallophosphoesterase family protein n=1 Tax=Vitiosangium sp. (strain GDMCC 1.1324) TaxID=2138576 RepID=UPI000D38A729|nr:metallophosphoesterase [Vitiosangium sp. GDMCC 1.1324]PTL77097.1 alkaline phosphatase [Vitiosangium sp. GDMCC 1.1324]